MNIDTTAARTNAKRKMDIPDSINCILCKGNKGDKKIAQLRARSKIHKAIHALHQYYTFVFCPLFFSLTNLIKNSKLN